MKRFLIDANLPYRVTVWQKESFIFVTDIDEEWSDSGIWNYVKKNNYTIVTKDADFSNRIMVSGPPPKIIHLRIGNMRLRDFVRFVDENWRRLIRFPKIIN